MDCASGWQRYSRMRRQSHKARQELLKKFSDFMESQKGTEGELAEGGAPDQETFRVPICPLQAGDTDRFALPFPWCLVYHITCPYLVQGSGGRALVP